MDTLSNVYSREGGNLLSSARLIPRTTSSQDKPGVSVENAPLTAEDNCEQEQQKQWFVLRVAYHHEQVAKDWLAEVGIDSYLPMHYAEKEVAGKKKRVQEPLIPNLLFVQTTEERLNLALASPAMPISVTTTITSAPTPTARIPHSPFPTSRWITSSA